MKFKIGDRVKTKEGLKGTIRSVYDKSVAIQLDGNPQSSLEYWKVNVEPIRLSRKEIKKELSDLAMESSGNIQSQLMGLSLLASTAKRKFLHKLLRQLSAEAFCVDKVLAERIDQLADGV